VSWRSDQPRTRVYPFILEPIGSVNRIHVLWLRDIAAASELERGQWLDTYCDVLEEKYSAQSYGVELQLEPLDSAAVSSLREATTVSALQTAAAAVAYSLDELIRSAQQRRFERLGRREGDKSCAHEPGAA
jgi:hypothetical protein